MAFACPRSGKNMARRRQLLALVLLLAAQLVLGHQTPEEDNPHPQNHQRPESVMELRRLLHAEAEVQNMNQDAEVLLPIKDNVEMLIRIFSINLL